MKAEELISKYKKKSASSILKSDNISSSSKNVTTNKPKKKNKKIEVMKLKSKAQGWKFIVCSLFFVKKNFKSWFGKNSEIF